MRVYLVIYTMSNGIEREATFNAGSWNLAMRQALSPDPAENIVWTNVDKVSVEVLA